MRIRFISDLHYALNMMYSPTEFIDYTKKIEPADITFIAGDLNADLDEALMFFQEFFPNEKVIFIGGNHLTYHKHAEAFEDLIVSYKRTFNKDTFGGKWVFLENDYMWLNDDIAVIGTVGWTDFLYGYETRSHYIKRINNRKHYIETHPKHYFGNDPEFGGWRDVIYTDNLPEDPGLYYDEHKLGDKKRFRSLTMQDAWKHMNDYCYGKMYYRNKLVNMNPQYTYKMHRISLKEIKRCYNEIVAKNPNATIILMTHHPFVKDCIAQRYKNSTLNPAFVSDHGKWLKKFPNIKYLHCGHVHGRLFKKVVGKQLICNPMGYLYNYEDRQDTPFNINCILEIS